MAQAAINEIYALPGFTLIRMCPKPWAASGLGYTALIIRLMERALKRHAADKAPCSSITAG